MLKLVYSLSLTHFGLFLISGFFTQEQTYRASLSNKIILKKRLKYTAYGRIFLYSIRQALLTYRI
jgi:hypothetical protein